MILLIGCIGYTVQTLPDQWQFFWRVSRWRVLVPPLAKETSRSIVELPTQVLYRLLQTQFGAVNVSAPEPWRWYLLVQNEFVLGQVNWLIQILPLLLLHLLFLKLLLLFLLRNCLVYLLHYHFSFINGFIVALQCLIDHEDSLRVIF